MEGKIKHRVQTYSESKNSIFYRFIKKIILDAREKFFNHFKNSTEYNDDLSLLDIGTTPSLDNDSCNEDLFCDRTTNKCQTESAHFSL